MNTPSTKPFTLEIPTVEYLENFKKQLLIEIREIVKEEMSKKPEMAFKKLLTGAEVRKLLKISEGSLTHYRNSGTLPCKRIGGSIRYRIEDVERFMGKDLF